MLIAARNNAGKIARIISPTSARSVLLHRGRGFSVLWLWRASSQHHHLPPRSWFFCSRLRRPFHPPPLFSVSLPHAKGSAMSRLERLSIRLMRHLFACEPYIRRKDLPLSGVRAVPDSAARGKRRRCFRQLSARLHWLPAIPPGSPPQFCRGFRNAGPETRPSFLRRSECRAPQSRAASEDSASARCF